MAPPVIQGKFLTGTPDFSRAVLVQPHAHGPAARALAPHVQAALGQHGHAAPVQRRVALPPPAPSRLGNAIAVPPTIQLATAGPGQPVPIQLRREMEGLLNADFSAVRIHVGPQAAQIGAVAFTMGSQIYFAPGHYDPASAQGRRLLAHELTHVVQQRSGRARNPFVREVAVVQDPMLEAEAERMSVRIGAAPPAHADRPVQASFGHVGQRRLSAVVQLGKRDKTKKTRVRKAATDRRWTVAKGVVLEGATRHSGSGYLKQGTKLRVRPRRKYQSSRTEQVLGQISTLLYFALKDGDESVTEVEAMFAGGSIFLSCNAQSETTSLYNQLLFNNPNKRWDPTGYGGGKTLKITQRMGGKMEKLRGGKRDAQAQAVLKALDEGDVGWIDLQGDEPDFYCGLALEVPGQTWVIFGQDKRHAEVKLVKVLEAAGYKGGAVVQGKKRPCYTCASYMRLRHKSGYNITFSDNPGKLWQDEFNRSEADVQNEVIAALRRDVEANKTAYGEQYRSDSESDDD